MIMTYQQVASEAAHMYRSRQISTTRELRSRHSLIERSLVFLKTARRRTSTASHSTRGLHSPANTMPATLGVAQVICPLGCGSRRGATMM